MSVTPQKTIQWGICCPLTGPGQTSRPQGTIYSAKPKVQGSHKTPLHGDSSRHQLCAPNARPPTPGDRPQHGVGERADSTQKIWL